MHDEHTTTNMGYGLKLLIADRFPAERMGMLHLVSTMYTIETVIETDSWKDAQTYVNEHECDLLLLDISLPDIVNFSTISRLKKSNPNMSVVAIGPNWDDLYVFYILRVGVSAYIAKTAQESEFLAAIRKALNGQRYVSPSLDKILSIVQSNPGLLLPHETLSKRESQIMLLLVNGNTVTEIGRKLSLNVKTISTYKSRIFEKMQITNRLQLVQYAFNHNLISSKIYHNTSRVTHPM